MPALRAVARTRRGHAWASGFRLRNVRYRRFVKLFQDVSGVAFGQARRIISPFENGAGAFGVDEPTASSVNILLILDDPARQLRAGLTPDFVKGNP